MMKDWTVDHPPEDDSPVQVLCRVLPNEVASPMRDCHLAVSSGDHAAGDLFVSIGWRDAHGAIANVWYIAGWDMAQDCWTDARCFEVIGWQPMATFKAQN